MSASHAPNRSGVHPRSTTNNTNGDRFAEDRLHPVVHGLLAGIFGVDFTPEPERHVIDVVAIWR